MREQFIFNKGEAVIGFGQSRVWKVAVSREVVRRLETGLPKTADRGRAKM